MQFMLERETPPCDSKGFVIICLAFCQTDAWITINRNRYIGNKYPWRLVVSGISLSLYLPLHLYLTLHVFNAFHSQYVWNSFGFSWDIGVRWSLSSSSGTFPYKMFESTEGLTDLGHPVSCASVEFFVVKRWNPVFVKSLRHATHANQTVLIASGKRVHFLPSFLIKSKPKETTLPPIGQLLATKLSPLTEKWFIKRTCERSNSRTGTT